MKKYIVGNVKSIIYESNSGPYKVGVFRVKESNDEELLKYVNKTISFTGNFNELNNEIENIIASSFVPSNDNGGKNVELSFQQKVMR